VSNSQWIPETPKTFPVRASARGCRSNYGKALRTLKKTWSSRGAGLSPMGVPSNLRQPRLAKGLRHHLCVPATDTTHNIRGCHDNLRTEALFSVADVRWEESRWRGIYAGSTPPPPGRVAGLFQSSSPSTRRWADREFLSPISVILCASSLGRRTGPVYRSSNGEDRSCRFPRRRERRAVESPGHHHAQPRAVRAHVLPA